MHDPRELLPLPVVPGDRLGSESDFSAGYGTYTSRGFIYSALVGCKVIQPGPAVHDDSGTHLGRPCLIVTTPSTSGTLPTILSSLDGDGSPDISFNDQLPAIGATVWARVVRVSSRAVHVDILMAEPTTDGIYGEPFKGQIRVQDIRSYELDSLKPPECYRPGDIILARVISTGDSRGGFLLSTASINCGVVFGRSQAGGSLDPISYKFMKCTKTETLELRKVARPHTPTELHPNEQTNSQKTAQT